CFVASGAVAVHLPDNTLIELGSGEFFGELGLLGEQQITPEVTSLGYCKLLMLSSRDFHALLARDEHLRERIQVVAKQRLRAIEVWKQFSQASHAAPAATPAPVSAPSPAQAAEAAEAAGVTRELEVARKDETGDNVQEKSREETQDMIQNKTQDKTQDVIQNKTLDGGAGGMQDAPATDAPGAALR
ncbi:MAG: cyclic nucleotide-binding domain-containing protein, partial [Achromobacter spanius]